VAARATYCSAVSTRCSQRWQTIVLTEGPHRSLYIRFSVNVRYATVKKTAIISILTNRFCFHNHWHTSNIHNPVTVPSRTRFSIILIQNEFITSFGLHTSSWDTLYTAIVRYVRRFLLRPCSCYVYIVSYLHQARHITVLN